MKTALTALVLLLAGNALAQDTYQITIKLRDAAGKRTSQDLDVTDWLESFPNPADLMGRISKKVTIAGQARVEIGYYHGTSAQNRDPKPGHMLNIFDLSVRTADGKESFCYNSFFVNDLRETPYVHQTCPIGNGKTVIVDFTSKKFW